MNNEPFYKVYLSPLYKRVDETDWKPVLLSIENGYFSVKREEKDSKTVSRLNFFNKGALLTYVKRVNNEYIVRKVLIGTSMLLSSSITSPYMFQAKAEYDEVKLVDSIFDKIDTGSSDKYDFMSLLNVLHEGRFKTVYSNVDFSKVLGEKFLSLGDNRDAIEYDLNPELSDVLNMAKNIPDKVYIPNLYIGSPKKYTNLTLSDLINPDFEYIELELGTRDLPLLKKNEIKQVKKGRAFPMLYGLRKYVGTRTLTFFVEYLLSGDGYRKRYEIVTLIDPIKYKGDTTLQSRLNPLSDYFTSAFDIEGLSQDLNSVGWIPLKGYDESRFKKYAKSQKVRQIRVSNIGNEFKDFIVSSGVYLNSEKEGVTLQDNTLVLVNDYLNKLLNVFVLHNIDEQKLLKLEKDLEPIIYNAYLKANGLRIS